MARHAASFDTVLARRAQCVLSFSRFEWADLENQDLDKRVIAPFQRVICTVLPVRGAALIEKK